MIPPLKRFDLREAPGVSRVQMGRGHFGTLDYIAALIIIIINESGPIHAQGSVVAMEG